MVPSYLQGTDRPHTFHCPYPVGSLCLLLNFFHSAHLQDQGHWHGPHPVEVKASGLLSYVMSGFSRVQILATLWTVAHRLPSPWDSPGKNPGAGRHFLLQVIFLTQGSNLRVLCLLNWQADSLSLMPPGKPVLSWVSRLLTPWWLRL